MKSIYGFVAETAIKYMGKRKIVLLGEQGEVLDALNGYGIHAENIMVLKDAHEANIESLKEKNNQLYIVVAIYSRSEERKVVFEHLGYREVYDYMFVFGIERFVTQEMYVDVKKTDVMNIMGFTSLGRMPFVLPHMQMLQDKHPNKKIHFYLLYHASAVPETVQTFQRIARYAKAFKNIELRGVPVGEEDEKIHELLDKYIGLNGFQNSFNTAGGSYYILLAHKYLPKSLDRVMYIDIGDTVINDSLEPFYYESFEDKSMIVTIGRDTSLRDANGRLRPFGIQDLKNESYVKRIAHETFNGGVKLFNLEKIRKNNYSIQDYINYAKKIQEKYHLGADLFYDQGLLGFLFLGDTKFYKMKEFDDEKFMPFNHTVYLFLDSNLNYREVYYEPAIVHFCGKKPIRPWQVTYPQRLETYQDGITLKMGNKNAEKYYLQWYYAAMKAEQIIKKGDEEYLPKNIFDICNIENIEEYIHCLNYIASRFLLCISIKDTAGLRLQNHLAKKLTELGLVDLRKEGRWSYVFAQIKGKVILNKLNGFESTTVERVTYNNHTIDMVSKSFNKGYLAKIIVDGKDYAVNCRGMNIVVFDIEKERIVDTVGFDTVLESNKCYRKSSLYYAVNGVSSQSDSFQKIFTLMSGRVYTDITSECKDIIAMVEGKHNKALKGR